ncbi:MAG: NADAR family protein [Candidatus Dependentiae bacterium]|nr:NADAR family protein [Candidatus Dependentiae bacterium]
MVKNIIALGGFSVLCTSLIMAQDLLPKGLKIPSVTGTSECEAKTKATYIQHLWRHEEAAKTDPQNDDFFIYFFKGKNADKSGRGGAYASLANTSTDPNEDPMAAKFRVKYFNIKMDDSIPVAKHVKVPVYVLYATSEHYFQIHKFDNPREAWGELNALKADQLPQAAQTAAAQHKFGGQRKDWHTGGSIKTMLTAVRAKFAQNKGLGQLLLSTYPKILVEDTAQRDQKSGGDPIWGANPSYSGCNQLGQILMHVRQELHDGKFYTFSCKHDAQYYYELLNGSRQWQEDINPDATLIPFWRDEKNYSQLLAQIAREREEAAGRGKGGKKGDGGARGAETGEADLLNLAQSLRMLAE